MDVDAVLAQFRHELRDVRRDDETLERRPLVTRRSFASGRPDDVVAFALDEGNADSTIRAELERRIGMEWKAFSFDSPPDLVERLRAAGFTVGKREAVVVYDLADGLEPFAGTAPFDVRHIDTEARLVDFRSVAEEAFGKDYSLTTGQLAEALRTGAKGHDAYVVYVDGEPAAAGRLYTHPRSAFAGLSGGGTVPAFRRRGLYRAVVAARARDAAAFGARYLLVDALPTSLPILLRMGFVKVADTWPCEWEPSTP